MAVVLLELHKFACRSCSLEENEINVYLKAWVNIKSVFCISERRKCLKSKRPEMSGFEFNEKIKFNNTYLN